MTLFKAELIYFLRSPIIWLIMALSAFISAWFFLLSLELFSNMQIKFAQMSDAPTLLQGIIFPVVSAQAQLSIGIVAIIAGLSFSRLHNNNGWLLIKMQQRTEWFVIRCKYFALMVIVMIFLLPTFLAVLSLVWMTELPIFPVIISFLGLLMLLMWMVALGMYISSMVNNAGFSILLCLVFLVILWLLSYSGLGEQWGKNWLQVLSPRYHFNQFLSNYLSLASLVFFILGTLLMLYATKVRLIHKRYTIL